MNEENKIEKQEKREGGREKRRGEERGQEESGNVFTDLTQYSC
jgi:hypothetical protein